MTDARGGPLLGSNPVGGGASNIWDITPGGGPDVLLPASPVPISALSGISLPGPYGVPGTLLGSLGHNGGGAITTHNIVTGALLGMRANTVGADAIPGLDVAPPAAAAFGFIPGHIYGTADIGTGVSGTLVDLGPAGAGPDGIVAPLLDAGGALIGGVDGITFDPDTGMLYGGTGFWAYTAPHLVDLTALATGGPVVDLGAVMVGGAPATGTVAGLQWLGGSLSGGTLYGSLGSTVGDLIAFPGAVPGAGMLDHNVTAGGGSLSGLALVPEPATIVLLGLGALSLLRRRRK